MLVSYWPLAHWICQLSLREALATTRHEALPFITKDLRTMADDDKKRTQEASETNFTTRGGRQDETSGAGKPWTSPCKRGPETPADDADPDAETVVGPTRAPPLTSSRARPCIKTQGTAPAGGHNGKKNAVHFTVIPGAQTFGKNVTSGMRSRS